MSHDRVAETVRRSGFSEVADRSMWYWKIVIYRRMAGEAA